MQTDLAIIAGLLTAILVEAIVIAVAVRQIRDNLKEKANDR